MREESHLEEMRSAIRGDFERLAERRGEQELLLRVADEPPPDPEPEPSAPPAQLEPMPEADRQPKPEPEPEPAGERRSWLARLLSPH
jgi:hypothetical protein